MGRVESQPDETPVSPVKGVAVETPYPPQTVIPQFVGRVEPQPVETVVTPVKSVTVETTYPPQTRIPQFVGRPWSSGLFDCHLDQTNALITAFLPCVTFGQIAEVMDAGLMSCPMGTFTYMLMMTTTCSQCIMGSKYRGHVRKKYGLVEAPYTDVVSHVLCSCCALCQEYRELKARGLDPALGWNGIVAVQQAMQHGSHDQTNQPPPVQAMSN